MRAISCVPSTYTLRARLPSVAAMVSRPAATVRSMRREARVALARRRRYAARVSQTAPLQKPQAKTGRKVVLGIVASVLVPVVAALVLRIFVVEAFKVPSGSMVPTLVVGDHVFVLKRASAAERGGVLVFKFPENPQQDFVKRVAATGGDRLEVIDGRPVVNGTVVPQCFVGPYATGDRDAFLYLEKAGAHVYGVLHDRRVDAEKCETKDDCKEGKSCIHDLCVETVKGPWDVKPGEFWVLGDNRDNSHDSPMWNGGQGRGVPDELAIGTPSMIFFGVTAGRTGKSAAGVPVLDASNAALQGALDRCAKELGAP